MGGGGGGAVGWGSRMGWGRVVRVGDGGGVGGSEVGAVRWGR